jgi:hypothetical protein
MAQEERNEKSIGTNWLDSLQNPRGLAIKKFMAELLNEKYVQYQDLISRISTCIITDGDMIAFNKLVNDIHEIGFTRAIDVYKQQLTNLGIKVTVKKNQDSGQ